MTTDIHINTNSIHAWWLAIRPRTLSGAAVPVAVALAAAWANGSLQALPACCCMLFALLMQIEANLVNDYIDGKQGRDNEDRLGPPRACASGWVTPSAMRRAIAIVLLPACLCGLPLIHYGGAGMVAVGLACVVFCFLYTTLLARKAMGDLLVLVFFGLVPVCLTYYIQTHTLPLYVVSLALAIGCYTDCLLLVNNYRDMAQDEACGKITLAVLLGHRRTELAYLLCGLAALLFCQALWLTPHVAGAVASWFLLPVHLITWRKMCAIGYGRELNTILAATARQILLLGILLVAGIVMNPAA